MSEQNETVNRPEDADADVEGHVRKDKQPGQSDRHSDEGDDDVEGHLRR